MTFWIENMSVISNKWH